MLLPIDKGLSFLQHTKSVRIMNPMNNNINIMLHCRK